MSILQERRWKKKGQSRITEVEVATKRKLASVTPEAAKEIILGRLRRVNSAKAERLDFNPIKLKKATSCE